MEGNGELDQKEDVTSYGVKINKQQIKSVPVEQQEAELQALGVSVYEQDEFEQSVINQVDSFLHDKEASIATRALEKELKEIREEISNTEEELKLLENELQSFGSEKPDDYDIRRRRDAIIRYKDNKLNQFKKLQAREKYAIKRLSDKHALAKSRFLGQKDCAIENEAQITSLEKSNETVHNDEFQDSINALPDYAPTTVYDEPPFDTVYNADDYLYDFVKSRKRRSRRAPDGDDSDDDFVPCDQVESSEEDEAARIEYERRRAPSLKLKKRKLSQHHKELKEALAQARASQKRAKIVDDGDEEAYRSRIRLLKLKERLKEKGEWDASYAESLSDDGLGDNTGHFSVTSSFKVPSRIWNRLYKYQKTGVKWLYELHSQQAGGIIGDEMGLGKTIQVIGLLAGLSVSKIGRYGSGRLGLGPVLIVCPATVLQQWVREFHRWWPPLRVAILHETGSFSGKKDILIRKIIKEGGILVTSYSNMRIHQDHLHAHGWDYVILDEGHKIRNPDAEVTLAVKQFPTPHRIILSGSPMQNNLKELWSLIDFVFPGKLGTLPVFMAEFAVPITTGGYANATTVQVQTAYKCACILRDTINPYLLRRLKKDVKLNIRLPSKNEQVLFCRLTEEQVRLYKLYLNSREVHSILTSRMKVFPGLIMLRKICNHPDLTSTAGSLEWMKEKSQGVSGGSAQLTEETEYEGGYGHWERSGKLVVTETLLRMWKQQGHRVLLFSQTRQMLDILESFVRRQGYSYQRMDGSTSIASRQSAVDNFNKDTSIFVYLLTTRVGGLGLNLIGADRIIIYDPDWNPSTDTQARERSWRIGQDKHVTIYRLLTTGTIEEKIYHRQIFKQFLANRVLTNPMQRRFFKSNDMYELFTYGDVRPNQGTETSAIFAGTGSEIKLGVREGENNKSNKKHRSVKKSVEDKKKVKEDKVKSGSAWTVSTRDIATLCSKSMSSEDRVEHHLSPCKMSVPASSRSELVSNEELNPSLVGNAVIEAPHSCDKLRTLSKTHDEETKILVTKPRFATEVINPSMGRGSDQGSSDLNKVPSAGKVMKRKSKTKKKDAKVDGMRIRNLDRRDVYKRSSDQTCVDTTEDDKTRNKNHDEDILSSLLLSSGVHSALKHDKIEDPNNPDFVLVEKEAERVAKQAVSALKRSRNECRRAVTGIPTWTGSHGAAGIPGVKPRFGQRKPSQPRLIVTQRAPASDPNADSGDEDDASLFSGGVLLKNKDGANKGPSSSTLLSKMRARRSETHEEGPSTSSANKTEEERLLEDIRDFVAYRSKTFGQASTQELLNEFQSRVGLTRTALFKELLKQVCYMRKVDGTGMWFLKEEFK